MVDFPADIWVRAAIEQGKIYNFSPSLTTYNRYYIVLNRNPKQDDEIYLVTFTTKKVKVLEFVRTRGLNNETIVDIREGECPFLSRPHETIIDCNRILSTNKERLTNLINNSGGSCNYSKVGEKLLLRIINGVRASKLADPAIKQIL